MSSNGRRRFNLIICKFIRRMIGEKVLVAKSNISIFIVDDLGLFIMVIIDRIVIYSYLIFKL